VDQFLRFVAVNAIIANNDSYLRGGHNFYIYLDPKDGKVRFIPWDQDLDMCTRGGGGLCAQTYVLRTFSGVQPVMYWLLEDPDIASQAQPSQRRRRSSRNPDDEMVHALETVSGGHHTASFPRQPVDYMQRLVASWGGRDSD
jgi:hypothetical protein